MNESIGRALYSVSFERVSLQVSFQHVVFSEPLTVPIWMTLFELSVAANIIMYQLRQNKLEIVRLGDKKSINFQFDPSIYALISVLYMFSFMIITTWRSFLSLTFVAD